MLLAVEELPLQGEPPALASWGLAGHLPHWGPTYLHTLTPLPGPYLTAELSSAESRARAGSSQPLFCPPAALRFGCLREETEAQSVTGSFMSEVTHMATRWL